MFQPIHYEYRHLSVSSPDPLTRHKTRISKVTAQGLALPVSFLCGLAVATRQAVLRIETSQLRMLLNIRGIHLSTPPEQPVCPPDLATIQQHYITK